MHGRASSQGTTSDRDRDDRVDSKDPPPAGHAEFTVQCFMDPSLENSGEESTTGSRSLKYIRAFREFVLFVPRANDEEAESCPVRAPSVCDDRSTSLLTDRDNIPIRTVPQRIESHRRASSS